MTDFNYLDTDGFDNSAKSIARRGRTLDNDIQQALVSGLRLLCTDWNWNTTRLSRFIGQQLPKSAKRKNAADWLKAMGAVGDESIFKSVDPKTGTIKLAKVEIREQFVAMLDEAMEIAIDTHWSEFKAPNGDKPFDLEEYLTKVLKKLDSEEIDVADATATLVTLANKAQAKK